MDSLGGQVETRPELHRGAVNHEWHAPPCISSALLAGGAAKHHNFRRQGLPDSSILFLVRPTDKVARHPPRPAPLYLQPTTMAAALSSKLSVAALTAAKPVQRAQRVGVVAQAGKTQAGKTQAGKTTKSAPSSSELSPGQECEWGGRARRLGSSSAPGGLPRLPRARLRRRQPPRGSAAATDQQRRGRHWRKRRCMR